MAGVRWFSRELVKAGVYDDQLLLAALHMGQEHTYVFTQVFAAWGNPYWMAVPTELLAVSFGDCALAETWRRIRSE